MHADITTTEPLNLQTVILPGTIPPAPAVMRILSFFNREELGHAIEVLIALLDVWDGDPDLEPNGDELDGSMGEDDFCIHNTGSDYAAGCPVSDPGGTDLER